jgi:hypothetical protein
LRQRQRVGKRAGRHRPEAGQARAQQFDQRGLARPRLLRELGRCLDRGRMRRAGIQGLRLWQSLGREPQAGADVDAGRAMVLRECLQQLRPAGIGQRLARADAAQAHQRVVHLVGVARPGPGLFAHLRDRVGIEPPEVASAVGIGIAARHDRLGAAFFQRRIVEEGVGTRVERLGGER